MSWSGEYRVQGIGSNQTSTYIAGRSPSGINAEELDPATLGRVGPVTNLASFMGSSDAGVTRVNVVSASLGPALIWVSQGGSATLHRMQTQSLSSLSMSSPGLVTQGDDIIVATNRWLATSRCSDNCSFPGVTSSATGTVARLVSGSFDGNNSALGAPTEFSTILGQAGGPAVFDPGSPIRIATDGSGAFFLAGQDSSGRLVVQRRDLTTGALLVEYASTGAIKLADMTRAQMGTAVYLLVTVGQVSSFSGAIFNPVAANLGNVAVIRIDTIVNASFFDIPLDQQAVAFTKSQGFLYIAVQEGTNAVLWRTPAP